MRMRLFMLAFLAVLMVALIPLHGQRPDLDGPRRPQQQRRLRLGD